MKCAQHNNRDAVGQCQDCGRGLCPECLEKYGYPCCNNCAASSLADHRSHWMKQAVIGGVAFVIGLVILLSSGAPFATALVAALFFAGIPWGWSALSSIQPRMFLFLSFAGWVMYFIIKLWLATIIGIFIMPFKIYKIVTELRAAKATESYISS